mmetsp:Transcript_3764/g.5790  ORF Transcript_3764/g.5790 Transcript_3764/m.5790 type:complete len:665 (-) Transcript_3764:82-2076(-)|eukprot:scaffold14999_cov155-Skeletonema_dohrnii-CCMP3373.AAC.1
MNLKLLSTSAALALSSIVKTGGAESKAVLADKIAASYEKHLDTHDRYPRKRILDHARNLQARLRKDADGPAARSGDRISAANTVSGAAGKRPDVGILGKHHAARRLRPDNSNLHTKKRVTGNRVANMIKKATSPDVGILGKIKAGRHRSSIDTANEPRQPPTKSVEEFEVEEEWEEWDMGHYSDSDYYSSFYSEPKTYLCEYSDTSGVVPRRRNREWIRQSANSSGTFLDDLPLPTCRCKDDQLSNCGPDLCSCLESSQGDMTSCMDEVNMLCEGTATEPNSTSTFNNNGTEIFTAQSLTMDQCTGDEFSSAAYCTMIPCMVGGGSYEQCMCDTMDHICNKTSDDYYSAVTCTMSTCCKDQTDDAGRLSCFDVPLSGYYGPYTYGSNETYPTFATDYFECISSPTNSHQCVCSLLSTYCELYSEYCDIVTCCQSQVDDAGNIDCFTSAFYETCMDDVYSKYFCLCEKSAIACQLGADPKQCELYDCCFSSSDYDDDEHLKACLGLGGDENHPSSAVTAAPTTPVSLVNSTHTSDPASVGVNAKSSKTKAGKSKTSKAVAKAKQNSPAALAAPTNPAPPLTKPTHTSHVAGVGMFAKSRKAKVGKSKSSKVVVKQKSPAAPAPAAPANPVPVYVINPIHTVDPVSVGVNAKSSKSKSSKSKSSKV